SGSATFSQPPCCSRTRNTNGWPRGLGLASVPLGGAPGLGKMPTDVRMASATTAGGGPGGGGGGGGAVTTGAAGGPGAATAVGTTRCRPLHADRPNTPRATNANTATTVAATRISAFPGTDG